MNNKLDARALSLSAAGILGGMIEAFVISLALVYPTVYFYNRVSTIESTVGV